MCRLSVRVATIAFTLALVMPSTLSAQGAKKKVAPPPQPGPVKLPTKDGLELAGYYFGSNKGKEAIPVMIVHEWKGQKAPYGKLCTALRDAGCAVLALDYRGHGGSREYTDPSGTTQEFDLERMRKQHVLAIVKYDLDAAKAFLEKENNEGKLNLNALVVIGVREGCVLAAGWTQRDWSFVPVGTRKQGQDVKALVLVSPKRLLKGVPIESSLGVPTVAALPTMMVVGEGSEEQSDTSRIYKRLEAAKKRISGGKDPEGLELMEVKQPLGGPFLVNESAKVIPEIVKFVTSQVPISDTDNPWIER
ncbi:Alpha/beta hydrolase family protein [Stieleria maiorica]|uniref:Alpha/beta hydrolase family protein n=1 Tax=Stieleria maiorica TaxID=2795974 RepID=A0A5B9M9P5_9BACT|nr:lysophospholipase [Stieleria maiorica]QEF96770.1 Alpha/beta hydrolase family protein [Stieleria maiorica]